MAATASESSANPAAEPVAETWTEFQLEGRKAGLMAELEAISETITASKESRKSLSAKTREFGSLPKAERSKQFAPFFKLYQAEINSLTLRAKQAEAVVYEVVPFLLSAVDPSDLETSVATLHERVSHAMNISADVVVEKEDLEEQVGDLKARIVELEGQLAKLSAANQKRDGHEAALVSELEGKNADLEAELASLQEERNALHAMVETTAAAHGDIIDDLQDKVSAANAALADAQNSLAEGAVRYGKLEQQAADEAELVATLRVTIGELSEENGRLASRVEALEAAKLGAASNTDANEVEAAGDGADAAVDDDEVAAGEPDSDEDGWGSDGGWGDDDGSSSVAAADPDVAGVETEVDEEANAEDDAGANSERTAALEAEVATLRDSLKAETATRDAAEERVRDLEADVWRLAGEVEEMTPLKELLAKRDTEVAKLQEEVEAREARIALLEERVADLVDEVKTNATVAVEAGAPTPADKSASTSSGGGDEDGVAGSGGVDLASVLERLGRLEAIEAALAAVSDDVTAICSHFA